VLLWSSFKKGGLSAKVVKCVKSEEKSEQWLGVILVIIILIIGGCAEPSRRKILENQRYPAIYDNIVVWQDDGNRNYDIHGYDLSTGEEFPVTTHSDPQILPAIHGDIVVWEDTRNGNSDIYGYFAVLALLALLFVLFLFLLPLFIVLQFQNRNISGIFGILFIVLLPSGIMVTFSGSAFAFR
jgi:beta propeller repeat protein